MLFTDADIAAIRSILVRRLPRTPALQALVEDHLGAHGTRRPGSEGRDDAQRLGDAWIEAARGVNRSIAQLCQSQDQTAPQSDSPSGDLSAPGYRKVILEARAAAARSVPDDLFFEPALNLALRLLALNRRVGLSE